MWIKNVWSAQWLYKKKLMVWGKWGKAYGNTPDIGFGVGTYQYGEAIRLESGKTMIPVVLICLMNG